MDNPVNKNSAQPILTETMAKLLLNQRHWREAIAIYQELSHQNPGKAEIYQKEIAQIKDYFKPQANPERSRKRSQTRKQISRLENLLKVVEKGQLQAYKQVKT